MNNYQNKGIKSWTTTDTENYFKDLLENNNKESLRVITSKELTDEEDLELQSLIATWYFKENLKRSDNLIEDLLKTIKFHTDCKDFLLQIYIPVGKDEMCFGLKFEAIERKGIIQIGVGSFQECILKGLNNYLTNNPKAKAMLIVKGFDTNKLISYNENNYIVDAYKKDVFHFVIENEIIYGVDIENAAKIQEYDFTTQKYIGKEIGLNYIDTHAIIAEFEVDKLMHEVGIYLLNH